MQPSFFHNVAFNCLFIGWAAIPEGVAAFLLRKLFYAYILIENSYGNS